MLLKDQNYHYLLESIWHSEEVSESCDPEPESNDVVRSHVESSPTLAAFPCRHLTIEKLSFGLSLLGSYCFFAVFSRSIQTNTRYNVVQLHVESSTAGSFSMSPYNSSLMIRGVFCSVVQIGPTQESEKCNVLGLVVQKIETESFHYL